MTYKVFNIPKKKGYRTIFAPNDELKTYQKKLVKPYEKYYLNCIKNTVIDNITHGFISGRNCVTAAEQHIGYQYTTMMDIKNFFDTVHRSMLPSFIAKDDRLFTKQGYCAQGFPTSPILCNIAMLPVIERIYNNLSAITNDFVFTIYADDITVSYNDISCKKSIISIITSTLFTYGFLISYKKTRTRKQHNGYRRILGINVSETEVRATRKIVRKLRAAIHQNNTDSIRGLSEWMLNKKPKIKT